MLNTLKKLSDQYGLIAFITLIIFLKGINHFFYIDDFIATPQFAHFDHWQYGLDDIKNAGKGWLFNLFFLTDILWAGIMLFLVYHRIGDYYCTPEKQNHYKGSVVYFLTEKNTYLWIFGLTWTLDILENISYIASFVQKTSAAFIVRFLPYIEFGKLFFYAFCLVIFLSYLISKYIRPNKIKLGQYLSSSYLTLFFLVLIVALMTQMEQGASLIIALLDHPGNLTGVAFMLIILSLIFSHYPIYFLFYKLHKSNMPADAWTRHAGCCKSGIITYNEKAEKNPDWEERDKQFMPYRYLLGNLVFMSFGYALFYTLDKYILNTSIAFQLITALLIWMIWMQNKVKVSLTNTGKTTESLSKFYLINYGVNWISLLSAIGLSHFHGWYWTTFVAFSLFIITRGMHRLINLSPENLQVPKNIFSKISFYLHEKEYDLTGPVVEKLTFIKWTGIVSFGLFICAHIPCISHKINPIIIILLYVHIAYGFILILLKNYIYYVSQKSKNEKPSLAMTLIFRNVLLILVVAFFCKKFWNQNINQIQYLKEYSFDKSQTIEVDSFINTFNQTHSKDSVRYYISSWGGGLRATYFNLLLLDKKQKESGNTFLNKVVAMSGVSGGSLGLNLFFSTKKENLVKGDIKISEIFDNIGNSNFASTDLAYLLGRDRLPFNQWLSRDRSIVGMNNYWSLITSRCTSFDTTSYQTYWKEGNERLGYFPLLITNTTKTSGNYGVAFSAYADKKKFDSIFKGATNILDIGDPQKSLSFYEAMSTTERFPFFSATASIRGQGHYIDGGYFDNSGLTSLMNLKNYVNSRESSVVVECPLIAKDSLIILGNSKSNLVDYYLAHSIMIGKNDRITLKIGGETDYGAILKGILNTDRLSNFLSDQHGIFGKNAKMINLPYHLRYTDFIKALGGEPQDLKDIESIRKLIKENNDAITNAINEYIKKGNPNINHRSKPLTKWDFAYPTLSRYLSRPTVNYYKAMIAYHESLKF